MKVMGPDAMILVFWMLSFKQAFSLSSFVFIKRLFSSSSLSAIRVVSSACLKLLISLGNHQHPVISLHLPHLQYKHFTTFTSVFYLSASMWSVSIFIAPSGVFDTLDQSASQWLPVLPQLSAGRFLLVCSCYPAHPLPAPKTCVLPWVVSSDLFHSDIPEWCYLSFKSHSLFKQVFLTLLETYSCISC